MTKTLTIFAVIASVFTVILSVLPVSNLAIFPGIPALLFIGGAFYLGKKNGDLKKLIPFSLILTIIALALTSYKAIFTTSEVENTKAFEAKEAEFEEAAIEELEGLDIEIDDAELGDLEINDAEMETLEIDDAQPETIEIKTEEIIESEIEASDLENLEIN